MCAIGAAALFAHFLPQLAEFVTALRELLVLRGAKVAHALLAMGSLTLGIRPCCIAFDKQTTSKNDNDT